jgi:hypothetical protein
MPHSDRSALHRSAAYTALVASRKSCTACTGLINPASCGGGIHDSDHIGPWTQWQANLHADLMIVSQDGRHALLQQQQRTGGRAQSDQ